MAAHNWRVIRTRQLDKGGVDLMALPSMHHVLDIMEQVCIESAMSGAKTSNEAKSKLNGFWNKLYAPDPTARVINGDGWQPVPEGFGEAEVEASFDAFMSAVNAQGG